MNKVERARILFNNIPGFGRLFKFRKDEWSFSFS